MEISSREVDGATVLDVAGKLIGGIENSERFHRLFKTLLTCGQRNFVLNLNDTPWADSQGIGILIGAYTSVMKAQGELVLAAPSVRVSNLLAVTQLNRLFIVRDTEEEALSYLRAAAATPGATRSLTNQSGVAGGSGARRTAVRW
jgi:anti-sigma B factor antagonist